jgi:hypothetical protein
MDRFSNVTNHFLEEEKMSMMFLSCALLTTMKTDESVEN